MTPQEQELVTELFDRLAKLENNTRDPDGGDCDLNKCRMPPFAKAELAAMMVNPETTSGRRKRPIGASH